MDFQALVILAVIDKRSYIYGKMSLVTAAKEAVKVMNDRNFDVPVALAKIGELRQAKYLEFEGFDLRLTRAGIGYYETLYANIKRVMDCLA